MHEILSFIIVAPIQDAPSDLQLQIYIMEDDFSRLSARGSSIKLARWYDETPRLHSLLFVSGTEELCMVEVSGRVRVFSLVTEQFRYVFQELFATIMMVEEFRDIE